ncbi:unnamed protein product [Gadus morhua 'NCC']
MNSLWSQESYSKADRYHDLRHPVHTRQLEPLQFVGVLAIGKAVALVRSLGAALSVDGMFSLPVHDIWGGSPATTSLENAVETAEVNGDTMDSCSESSISEQTEESVSPQTSSTQTPLQRRRGQLQIAAVARMRSKAITCTPSQADFPVDRRNTSHSIFALCDPERSHFSGELVPADLILCWDEDDEAPHVPVQYGTLEILLLRPRPFGNR